MRKKFKFGFSIAAPMNWGTSNIQHPTLNVEVMGCATVGQNLPASCFKVHFPLNPALSLGERGKLWNAIGRSQVIGSIQRRFV
jgi:hypothetical protein